MLDQTDNFRSDKSNGLKINDEGSWGRICKCIISINKLCYKNCNTILGMCKQIINWKEKCFLIGNGSKNCATFVHSYNLQLSHQII